MGENFDRFIKFMNNNKNSDIQPLKIAQYDGYIFKCGDLELDKEDVLVSETLKFGYVTDVKLNNGNLNVTKQGPLKTGDTVVIYRISDEQYIVLERLVEL